MSFLFSHLLLMLAMHSGKMYMPPSFSLWTNVNLNLNGVYFFYISCSFQFSGYSQLSCDSNKSLFLKRVVMGPTECQLSVQFEAAWQ